MIVRIVVEQPVGEMYRMKYLPDENRFIATEHLSLGYIRGFKGVYGWIDGYGHPPKPHKDVFMLTNNIYTLGQIVDGKIIGCFIRNDGDNKVVCIEPHRDEADINELYEDEICMIKSLYPRIDENEGWFGKGKAISLLEE